jgi:acyl carrier protein
VLWFIVLKNMKNATMKIILDAIIEVFPKQRSSEISPDLKLGEIDGWDSMNAVNLQIELEARMETGLLSFVVTDDLTIEQLVRQIDSQR